MNRSIGVAIVLMTALAGSYFVANVSHAGAEALGARELTQQLLTLQNSVQQLTGAVSVLQAENTALHSMLACVATDSGPMRLVLRGCDLAVERLPDGSAIYGNVEVGGVLVANEILAATNAADSRSGGLVIEADESILMRSGSASHVMESDGSVEVRGNDIAVTSAGDVAIRASSRIVLQAAQILQN